MNTLSRKVTKEYFFHGQEDGFTKLEEAWKKALANKVELTAAHHLFYQILRGKDWRKSFSELVNERKRLNGGIYNTGFKHAFDLLNSYAVSIESTSKWSNKKAATDFLSVFGESVTGNSLITAMNFTSHVKTTSEFKHLPAYDASKVPIKITLPSNELVEVPRD